VIGYLAMIPFSYKRFQDRLAQDKAAIVTDGQRMGQGLPSAQGGATFAAPPTDTKH
jgi:hypothetical protein